MAPPVGASRAGGCHSRGLGVGSSSILIISNTVARRFGPPLFHLRTGSGLHSRTEMLLFPPRGQESRISSPPRRLVCNPRAGVPEPIFCHTSNGNRLVSIWPLLFLECGTHFGRLHFEVNFPAVGRARKYYNSYDLADMTFCARQTCL